MNFVIVLVKNKTKTYYKLIKQAANKDFTKENFAMGRTGISGKSLKGFLEKHPGKHIKM